MISSGTKDEARTVRRRLNSSRALPAGVRYEAAVIFEQILEERRLKVARLRREIDEGVYRVKSDAIAAALIERIGEQLCA